MRQLPGPPPRQVNQWYIAALDTAISARELELSELQAAATKLKKEIDANYLRPVDLSHKVKAQSSLQMQMQMHLHLQLQLQLHQPLRKW